MAGLIPFNKNGLGARANGFDSFTNMLDDFFNDAWSPRRSLFSDTFKIDVKEDDREYTVEAEMPGVKKENIALSLDDGRLTIGVNRVEEIDNSDEGKSYIHRERRASSMQRSVYLADAATEGVAAKLEDGILRIAVPKEVKSSASRSIEIQ